MPRSLTFPHKCQQISLTYGQVNKGENNNVSRFAYNQDVFSLGKWAPPLLLCTPLLPALDLPTSVLRLTTDHLGSVRSRSSWEKHNYGFSRNSNKLLQYIENVCQLAWPLDSTHQSAQKYYLLYLARLTIVGGRFPPNTDSSSSICSQPQSEPLLKWQLTRADSINCLQNYIQIGEIRLKWILTVSVFLFKNEL